MRKIAIVTNSQSSELYNKSKQFYENLGYPMYNVSGANGMYSMKFLDHVISDPVKYDFEYMIYIDEDCFITDTVAMQDLFNYMIDNNYDTCGMPDGGVISHRFHNPISPNLFFSIFNIKKIREHYNKKNVFASKYGKDLDKFIPHSLIKKDIKYVKKYDTLVAKNYSPFGVIYDNFEPYYKLYFWMLRNNMKCLYLDGDDAHDLDESFDIFTTAIKTHTGKVFAYHSWFARAFTTRPAHKERITKLIDKCNTIKNGI